MTVADRIKMRREELNITQEELAKTLGLKGKSSVCKIESSGDNISTKSIRKYSNALGVSIAYLMGWESKSDKSTMALEHIINTNKEKGGSSKFAEQLYRDTVMPKNIELTKDEIALIDKYRNSSPEVRDAIITLLGFAAEQENKNNEN